MTQSVPLGLLRQRLDELGLTQAEVAREMELDVSIISLWCSGKRMVPANRLEHLAEALGIGLDELLAIEKAMGHEAALLAAATPPPPGERPKFVPPPIPRSEPPAPPRPSQDPYPLAWCSSTHGTSVRRVHHHGPRPAYGPPGPQPWDDL